MIVYLISNITMFLFVLVFFITSYTSLLLIYYTTCSDDSAWLPLRGPRFTALCSQTIHVADQNQSPLNNRHCAGMQPRALTRQIRGGSTGVCVCVCVCVCVSGPSNSSNNIIND